MGKPAAGLLLAISAAAAPSLESLAAGYRESPTAARKSALLQYAAAHPKDESGALARLALGVAAFEQKNYPAAIGFLQAAQPRLPKLADYTAYYLAASRAESDAMDSVPGQVAKVRAVSVISPWSSRAAVLEARALLASGKPDSAVRLLLQRYSELSQPDGDLALAGAYEAARDLPHAAAYYQQVYYNYPTADGAAKAAAALVTLRDALGATYLQPSPRQMLERAGKLLEQREYARARSEFQSLAGQLNGAGREHARVGIGAADFLQGISSACTYLKSLEPGDAEADSERLYYLVECARRTGDDDEMMSAVRRLGKQYPLSTWRLKALITAGNRYLVANQPEKYEPLFKAAGRDFPSEAAAPSCHWKYAWVAYLRRKSDAAARLRDHLKLFPQHPSAGSALYFLGRLAGAEKDYAAARAYYSKILELFPNYYYGLLARERLAEPKVVAATASEKTREFLAGISLQENKYAGKQEPTPATRLRIERARLLKSAGFGDWAHSELRFGARTDGQPVLLAVELARSADSPYLALRSIKSLAPDSLQVSFEEAPTGFWEYLFPLPYKADLLRSARSQNLDPYVVAGLIRQESEFNPQALSYANAYGLTQVRPATGRQLARRAGVRRFSNRMLFQPSTNLKLGTMYLRSLLDQWGGKWEETLAAYNAGPSRAKEWLSWAEYREPAEFVETIPFTQTREYVQAVLRNAALYRRIYQDRLAQVTPEAKPVKAVKRAAGKSRSSHKRVAKTRRAKSNS